MTNFSDAGRLRSSFMDFLRTERPELLPQPVGGGPLEIVDATTIVSLRYADGVVMAGDRRATEGFSIAHRAMEKVFAADAYSAVGIAGAAGPAVEMVRLFQTELEYYEKVEGEALSLAGKANRLGAPDPREPPRGDAGVRRPAAVRRLRHRKAEGRIYRYDVTGGLSEETDYHAIGSGGRDAKNSMKKLYGRAGRDRRRARDRDRGRGAGRRRRGGRRDGRSGPGPRDLSDGVGDRPGRRPAHAGRRRRDRRARCARAPDEQRWRSVSLSSPLHVRLARADHEGPRGLRAAQHRTRQADPRHRVHRRRAAARGEPVHDAAQGLGDLRPDRLRRGREVSGVREPAHPRDPPGRPQGLRVLTRRRHARARSRTSTRRCSTRSSRTRSSRTRSRSSSPASATTPTATEMYHVTFDGVMTDEHGYAAVGGQSDALKQHLTETYEAHARSERRDQAGRRGARGRPERRARRRTARSGRPRPNTAAPEVPPTAGVGARSSARVGPGHIGRPPVD